MRHRLIALAFSLNGLAAQGYVGDVFAVRGHSVEVTGSKIQEIRVGSRLNVRTAAGNVTVIAKFNFHTKLVCLAEAGAEKISKGDKVFTATRRQKSADNYSFEIPTGRGKIEIKSSRRARVFVLETHTLQRDFRMLLDADHSLEFYDDAIRKSMRDTQDERYQNLFIQLSALANTGRNAPLTIARAGAGSYHVWVMAEEGEKIRNSYDAFELRDGENKQLYFHLDDYVLNVTTDPPGARVLLAGKDTSLVTPAQMTVGWQKIRYEVAVSLEDYVGKLNRQTTPSVEIDIRQQRHVHFDLKYAEPFWFVVQGSPGNAGLSVNGVHRGAAAGRHKVLFDTENVIDIYRDGFLPQSVRINPKEAGYPAGGEREIGYFLTSKYSGNGFLIGYRGGTILHPNFSSRKFELHGYEIIVNGGGRFFFFDVNSSYILSGVNLQIVDVGMGMGLRAQLGWFRPYVTLGPKGFMIGEYSEAPWITGRTGKERLTFAYGGYTRAGFLISLGESFSMYAHAELDTLRVPSQSWYAAPYFGVGFKFGVATLGD